MALLKTVPDESVMKKYLEKDHILPIIEKHRKALSWKYATIKRFESEHIKLLSAQSYLVKYTITIVTDSGETFTMVLRGNRISPEAASMWQYLYDQSLKSKIHIVPTPLEYFSDDNFMLYEELSGKTLRDYDDKFPHLKKITPDIAKQIAWVHSLPIISQIGTHTVDAEKEYWQSVIDKINEHHPEKPEWINEALSKIHDTIISAMDAETFTLCHNDFQASNIIYNESTGKVGIIDFGNSTLFTPSLDIATHLVHLSVMTTKHLTQDEIHQLQRQFLATYLEVAPQELAKRVQDELPLYIARVATDIIATTAVALSHTQNPYRILIPKILLPVVKEKTALLGKTNHTIEDLLITLNK